jgi:hypothetical protein
MILKKHDWRLWIGLIWLMTGEVTGCCQQDNGTSGFIKCGDKLSAHRQDSDVEPLGRSCTKPPHPKSLNTVSKTLQQALRHNYTDPKETSKQN